MIPLKYADFVQEAWVAGDLWKQSYPLKLRCLKQRAEQAALVGQLWRQCHFISSAYKGTTLPVQVKSRNPVLFLNSSTGIPSQELQDFAKKISLDTFPELLEWLDAIKMKVMKEYQNELINMLKQLKPMHSLSFSLNPILMKMFNCIEIRLTIGSFSNGEEDHLKKAQERLTSVMSMLVGVDCLTHALALLRHSFIGTHFYNQKTLNEGPFVVFYPHLMHMLTTLGLSQQHPFCLALKDYLERHSDVPVHNVVVYKAGLETERDLLAYDLATILGLERCLIRKKPHSIDMWAKSSEGYFRLSGVPTVVSPYVRGTKFLFHYAKNYFKAPSPEAKQELQKECLQAISLGSYADLTFLMLLLGEMDGHYLQFCVEGGAIRAIELSEIAPPELCYKKDNVLYPIVRCFLLDLPHFQSVLPLSLRDKILSYDLEELTQALAHLIVEDENRYLSRQAAAWVLKRLELAQEHLQETCDATMESLFEAMYPQIYLFFKFLQKIEVFAGNDMGYTTDKQYSLEKLLKIALPEIGKKITSEEYAELWVAYNFLKQFTFG